MKRKKIIFPEYSPDNGPVVQWIEWQIPVLLVESSSLSGITKKGCREQPFFEDKKQRVKD
jgi:hypothetical protein